MSLSAQFEPMAQSRLDIFRKNKVQVTQLGYERVHLSPYNALTSTSNRLMFRHEGKSTDYYRFLKTMVLDLDFTVRGADGNAVDVKSEVGLINYFNQTMIDSVDIKLNGVYVTRNTKNYGYRAYIEALMSCTKEEAEGSLAAAGFYLDEGDNVEADSTKNAGFKKRFDLCKSGGQVCCMGNLHTDIGKSELYLPNGLDLEVIIDLNDSLFTLMSKEANNASIALKLAQLTIEICHINPAVLTAHARVFQDHNAVIPFQHVEVLTETAPKGVKTVSFDNLISGPLPAVMLVGMVDNKSYAGSSTTNPLCFKHYDINKMVVYNNGRPYYLGSFDFSATPPVYAPGYMGLLNASGLFKSGHSSMITYENYAHGFFLCGIDLTADGESGSHHTHSSVQKVGNLGLEASFDKELSEAVTFIIYCLWEGSTIEIDKFRNVFVSF